MDISKHFHVSLHGMFHHGSIHRYLLHGFWQDHLFTLAVILPFKYITLSCLDD